MLQKWKPDDVRMSLKLLMDPKTQWSKQTFAQIVQCFYHATIAADLIAKIENPVVKSICTIFGPVRNYLKGWSPPDEANNVSIL